jgi:hypothetical protein
MVTLGGRRYAPPSYKAWLKPLRRLPLVEGATLFHPTKHGQVHYVGWKSAAPSGRETGNCAPPPNKSMTKSIMTITLGGRRSAFPPYKTSPNPLWRLPLVEGSPVHILFNTYNKEFGV